MKYLILMMVVLQVSSTVLADDVVTMKPCDVITLENRVLTDNETGETFKYIKKVSCINSGTLTQCQQQQYPQSPAQTTDHQIISSTVLNYNPAQGMTQGMLYNGTHYTCSN